MNDEKATISITVKASGAFYACYICVISDFVKFLVISRNYGYLLTVNLTRHN